MHPLTQVNTSNCGLAKKGFSVHFYKLKKSGQSHILYICARKVIFFHSATAMDFKKTSCCVYLLHLHKMIPWLTDQGTFSFFNTLVTYYCIGTHDKKASHHPHKRKSMSVSIYGTNYKKSKWLLVHITRTYY